MEAKVSSASVTSYGFEFSVMQSDIKKTQKETQSDLIGLREKHAKELAVPKFVAQFGDKLMKTNSIYHGILETNANDKFRSSRRKSDVLMRNEQEAMTRKKRERNQNPRCLILKKSLPNISLRVV